MQVKSPLKLFKTIKLERTTCYGDCAVYKVEISSNGKVKFFSSELGERTGAFNWMIDSNAINLLNDSITKYSFFTMKEKKPTSFCTDVATYIISVRLLDGTYRKIENYLGDYKFPKRLTLENKIDKVIGVKNYIGVDM